MPKCPRSSGPMRKLLGEMAIAVPVGTGGLSSPDRGRSKALALLFLGRLLLGLGLRRHLPRGGGLGRGGTRGGLGVRFDLDDHFDLDRNAARQRAHADGRTGMTATLAEHFHEE